MWFCLRTVVTRMDLLQSIVEQSGVHLVVMKDETGHLFDYGLGRSVGSRVPRKHETGDPSGKPLAPERRFDAPLERRPRERHV